MKPGRKKNQNDEPVSRKPEPEEADRRNVAGDDPATTKMTREMIGGNPNGIDIIRVFQMITVGIATVLLIWVILHNILHVI